MIEILVCTTLTCLLCGDSEWVIGLIEWVMEWISKWVSEWVSNGVSEWLMEWVSEWVIEWVIDGVSNGVSEWLMEWVSEWVIEWVIDGVSNGVSDRVSKQVDEWGYYLSPGTIFLWVFWPSFNGGLAQGNAQYRAIINTYFSLAGSVISSYIFSMYVHGNKKIDMVSQINMHASLISLSYYSSLFSLKYIVT